MKPNNVEQLDDLNDDYAKRMGLADVSDEDVFVPRKKSDVIGGIQKIKAQKGEHALYKKVDEDKTKKKFR